MTAIIQTCCTKNIMIKRNPINKLFHFVKEAFSFVFKAFYKEQYLVMQMFFCVRQELGRKDNYGKHVHI